jgi:hypothetical protein
MKAPDLLGTQCPPVDAQQRTPETDRCRLFHGKADGLGGGAEMAGAGGARGNGIATQEKLPGRVQNVGIQLIFVFLSGALAGLVQRLGRSRG